MTDLIEVPKIPEFLDLKAESILDRAQREAIRGQLSELEDLAFSDQSERRKGINLIKEIPDSIYYNPSNLLVILKDGDNDGVLGFTFLERQGDSYYEVISCVKYPGNGHIEQILQKRDEELRAINVFEVCTHVDAGSKYAESLLKHYEEAPIGDLDKPFDSNQIALRYKIPSN